MGKKVLIIDDDEDTLALLGYLLRKAGYGVATCDDGRDAWGSILSTKPDLVFLDVMLPGIDGYSLLDSRIAKDESTRRIPILVLSALDTVRPMFARYPQVAGCFTKPFKNAAILEAVERAIGRPAGEPLLSRQ